MATATASKKAPAKKAAAKKPTTDKQILAAAEANDKLVAGRAIKKAPPAEKVPAATNGQAVTDSEAYANLADPVQRAEWMDRATLFELVSALVAERNRIEMTQADMARHLGLKQPALSLIETHKATPTISQLQRYARHIGWNVQLTLHRW